MPNASGLMAARGTTLTDDGLTVAAWARDLLHQLEVVHDGLEALSRSRSEHVADLGVAASLTIAEFVLPRWIGELRAKMPEVHLRLDVVNKFVQLIKFVQEETGHGSARVRAPRLELTEAEKAEARAVIEAASGRVPAGVGA